MRTGLLILALFAIVITGMQCEESRAQAIQDQPKNPDAEKLAKAIVVAITTDNYSAFTDLLVTQREYVSVMRSSTNPEVQARANDSLRGMQLLHERGRRSFDEIRKDGTRDGIAWDKAKYKSTTYSVDTAGGVELIHMTIVMDFRGAEYPIVANEVVKTKAGWKILGRMEYGTHYNEDLARQMMDSIAVADYLMMVQMQNLADSMRIADSLASARLFWQADSAHLADSVATSLKKKKEKKKK